MTVENIKKLRVSNCVGFWTRNHLATGTKVSDATYTYLKTLHSKLLDMFSYCLFLALGVCQFPNWQESHFFILPVKNSPSRQKALSGSK
jgi:hypothetical protein